MKFRPYLSLAVWLGAILPLAVSAAPDPNLLEKAQQGDVKAQNLVAMSYCFDGDYYKALDWYEKAAKQGHEFAQYTLANMYYDGKCASAQTEQAAPNYAKALEWYSRIAYKDKPEELSRKYNAMFKMADIYFFEKGGIKPPSGRSMRSRYEELATIPDSIIQQDKKAYPGIQQEFSVIQETRSNARFRLANMYYYSNGAPRDYALAYKWANKAVQDDMYYAYAILARLEYNGFGVQQNKPQAIKRMRALCEGFGDQAYCDAYNRMANGLPVK
ncbi:hypothetical protein A4G20_00735 [Pasteurellaceae bacterium RH1A]|nr:hypothetical protein A4G20_00735 [Pasteurellaceae bacterium RH1A]